MPLPRTLLLAALLLASCARSSADRAHWQQMPPSERVLYVKALLGAERARAAKGGNERTFSQPAEEYVKEIDAAYERGDRRRVDEVFGSLADRRRPPR